MTEVKTAPHFLPVQFPLFPMVIIGKDIFKIKERFPPDQEDQILVLND